MSMFYIEKIFYYERFLAIKYDTEHYLEYAIETRF